MSPAASSTSRPSSVSLRATLPIEVVFPTPLTPTNNHTGTAPCDAVNDNFRSRQRSLFICTFKASSKSLPFSSFSVSDVSRSRLTKSKVVSTPTSASINTSSSFSHIEESTGAPRMPLSRVEIMPRALDNRSRIETEGAPASRPEVSAGSRAPSCSSKCSRPRGSSNLLAAELVNRLCR